MADSFRQYDELVRAAQKATAVFSPMQHLAEQLAKSSSFMAVHRFGIGDALRDLQRRQEVLLPTLAIEQTIAKMRSIQEMSDRLGGDSLARIRDVQAMADRLGEDGLAKIRAVQDMADRLGTNGPMIAKMRAAQEMADLLGENFRNSLTCIDEQAKRWREMIEPAVAKLQHVDMLPHRFSGLADSLVAWEATMTRLTQRFDATGLVAQSGQLAARLLAPTEVFSDFARSTIDRIEHESNDRRAWAMEASLSLAEEQLIAATDTFSPLISAPEHDEEVSGSRELRSPYVQQDELLEAVEHLEGENAESLVGASSASKVADLSREVLSTIATCNETSKVAGQEEIFKPTTRLLEVFVDMPWLVPNEKKSFAEFVDCLYFLFYEGAGKDNLRFLKSHGGPIDDSDFDFILCVKHLRNKWTRHDADHGRETAIKKAWTELADKFQWLGLHHMPVSAADFRMLHMNLLAKSYEFANKILRGLVGS